MTPAIAFFGMFIKDSLEALIAQAEARNKGLVAGSLDVVKWFAEITVVGIAVINIHDDGWVKSIPILIGVSLGNFLGRLVGTNIGKRLIHED